MGLNQEQKEAVEYLEGPLLVLAGPGTGKTQLLSAKVAYILEKTDTNPENILCITFTESGATNMRARLTSMIGKDAAKVHIYTYHALGANILDRYKNYADLIDRPLDEPIDQVTQYKMVKTIQQNLPASDINKTANVKDLVETIGHAKNNRLTSTDLATIAEANLQDGAMISEKVSQHLSKLKGRDKFEYAVSEVYIPILEELAAFISAEPIVNNIERTANEMARDLKTAIDEESAKDKPKLKPLSAWKDKYFEKDNNGQYRIKDIIANKKLASLSNIMAAYDAKLQEQNLFDFADMIEYAIKLLKEDRGFRLSLSEIFQYVLLDEFQDTNPSQAELIGLITDYEKPNIMAVGDDDQAIFEFQGANASNLIDFKERYGAHVVTLLDNYRSNGKILEFSHRVATQIKNSFAKKHEINKVLRSMLDLLKPKNQQEIQSPKISRHEFISADAEYYWVSQNIRKLIDQGEEPSDIAIITPKHKYVAGLLPYLQAEKINIAYEKKSNLIDDPKIHEIIVMANFIQDLASGKNATHYLMEILAFPFWNNDPTTVIRIMEGSRYSNQSTLDFLLKSDDGHLQQIGKFFADLVFQALNTPLELWLNYLIGEVELNHYKSPYLDWYSKTSSDGELFEFYSNLNTIRNIITNHIKNEKPKLQDFVDTIHDYESADAAIVSTNPYQDAVSAVQIVSAHKSKGLEYKHVFIIATDNLAWGTSKGNNNMFALPKNLAQIRHTGNTDDECLRLFFVAITRAKENLILTNSKVDFSGKSPARLEYLDERELDNKVISPFLPEAAQEVILHEEFDDQCKITSSKYHWVSSYQNNVPDIKMLLQPRIANYKLTATDLTNFIDIVYAGPQSVYRDKFLQAPGEPLNLTTAYGNLVHSVFEKITNAKITDEEAINYFKDEANKMPLEKLEINELIDKGLTSFSQTLQEFREIIRQDHSKAEVNLSPEHLSFEGIPLAGKIDHINLNEDDKTIEVYDFKTGTFHDGKWRSHSTLYKYMLQLEFYKLLLNLSPTYSKYKVTKAHILFVTPDKNTGQVHDKPYEYNEDDEKEFKKLIQVVYHQLTTLNFLENPQLNLASDTNRQLKDVKAFIELLLNQEI